MKYVSALLSLAFCCSMLPLSAGASQTHAPAKKAAAQKPAPPKIAVAPADEYFGRLKMSILGIRNTLKDLAYKAEGNPGNAEQVFGSAAFAEEALKEWEHKYPRDPWLAKSVAALAHMYTKVPTPAGRAKMHAALAWLTAKYGGSKALVADVKAEVDEADKAIVAPAAAATTSAASPAGTAANAPASAASNAPAAPKPPV